MKYEANKMISIIFLETWNIEWGQIDPEGQAILSNNISSGIPAISSLVATNNESLFLTSFTLVNKMFSL